MPSHDTKTSFEIYREGGSPEDVQFFVRMVLLVRGFRGKLDEELRKIGQSTARMETLAAILNMPDPKSQSDIAKRLRIEGPTVKRMIDILSKEGLVKREPHPTDRRVNLVRITPDGESKLRDIFAVFDGLRHHVIKPLTREEVLQTSQIIDTMVGRLDIDVPGHIAIEQDAAKPEDPKASADGTGFKSE